MKDGPLDTGTVRVRWIVLEAAGRTDPARWREVLATDEVRRADQFRFAVDRDAFIAAHALKRVMLADAGGLPPSAWRYLVSDSGKPEITPELNPAGLRFSLAHTRGLVACALALKDDLGLDVEAIERPAVSLDVAQRSLALAELRMVRRMAQHRDTFLRLWTLKEAFVKATGEGLGRALDSVAFTLDPINLDVPAVNGNIDTPERWQFAQLRPSERHLLAVALRRPLAKPMQLDARGVSPSEF